jgi:hypothetical protein
MVHLVAIRALFEAEERVSPTDRTSIISLPIKKILITDSKRELEDPG